MTARLGLAEFTASSKHCAKPGWGSCTGTSLAIPQGCFGAAACPFNHPHHAGGVWLGGTPTQKKPSLVHLSTAPFSAVLSAGLGSQLTGDAIASPGGLGTGTMSSVAQGECVSPALGLFWVLLCWESTRYPWQSLGCFIASGAWGAQLLSLVLG